MAKKAKTPLGFFMAGDVDASLDDLDYWAIARTPEDAIREWKDKTGIVLTDGDPARVEIYELKRVGSYEVTEVTEVRMTRMKE